MIPVTVERSSHSAEASLAERKRQVTRRVLADAALELAMECGLEHVTVPRIAAAAGVSPRTFNNYFSSKEEAVVAPAFDRTMRILDAFAQRPASESIWDAVSAAILTQFPEDVETGSAFVGSARMIKADRALRGEQLKACAAIEELLAVAIAARMGTTSSSALAPHVAAASAITTARIAYDYWVDMDARSPLRAVVAEALTLSGNGFATIDTPEEH